jgi:Domain of unknown function (DUF2382)/PRC-barrel domain
MPDVDTVRNWQGGTMVDREGDRIGTIDAIYVDDQTGEPEWALVNTGFFGTRSTFVPIAQASAHGDQVQVPYEKQLIKDALNMDPDGHLSEQEEQELWRYYGLNDGGDAAGTTTADVGADRAAPYDDRDPVGRDVSGPTTDAAMTRSEEEHEVTLREEEVVVDERSVPKERVRLDTETVTDERQVSEEVRKERIEVEGDVDRR